MKSETKERIGGIVLTAGLLVGTCLEVRAQDPAQQIPVAPGQTQTQTQTQTANPANRPVDPLKQLDLTSDQIKKIRGIYAELKDQRQAANQRLIQAQRTLAEAIESPTPDENVIAQRSHEVADAQATTIRIRSLTEARVLQVLSPEQRVKLKEIKEQNQALRRANAQPQLPRANQQLPRNVQGQRPVGSQRNAAIPTIKPNQRRPGKQLKR